MYNTFFIRTMNMLLFTSHENFKNLLKILKKFSHTHTHTRAYIYVYIYIYIYTLNSAIFRPILQYTNNHYIYIYIYIYIYHHLIIVSCHQH